MSIAQEIFIKYVRTKMMFSLRFRSVEEEMGPVHISANEISDRFFPYPKYNRNKEVQALHEAGEIKITQRGKAYFYEALKPGAFDLNLLQLKAIPQDNVTQTMLKNIQKVTLPVDAPSTPYFDLFLKYKDIKPGLFFTVDDFCGRVHTPISNFHRSHRPSLLIDNEKTTSLDVVTMQPLLLAKILTRSLGENEYSTWINEGRDIYLELQNKAGLSTRDDAKKKFFKILFAKPNDDLKELFGGATWINWINDYKQTELPDNPHNIEKPYSNLAWLLQSTEVAIMRKVWTSLVNHNLPFLSVHDEIIVKESDFGQAKSIFESVLRGEFEYYKLNTKDQINPESNAKSEPPVNSDSIEITITNSKSTTPASDFKPVSKGFAPLWDIGELETYFETAKLPGKPIRLDNCSTVINIERFVKSHLEFVKCNNGNRIFAPYFERLIELRQVLLTV